MTLSNKQKAVLHVAKSKLGLSDTDYRRILVHVAGVTSSTELDRPGFDAVMGFMAYLGFEPMRKASQDYGVRPGMASFAQLELIRTLWSEYTRLDDEEALNKWLLRSFKVASLRFLDQRGARGAITALKAMKARAA